jgi:hypothetical protein
MINWDENELADVVVMMARVAKMDPFISIAKQKTNGKLRKTEFRFRA